MNNRCARCGVDSEKHATYCDPADIFRKMSVDNVPGVHRTTDKETATKASREDPVARAIYRDPYPPEWDIEDPNPTREELRVTHSRDGWTRRHSKIYQMRYYAERRFRRLARSSKRAGLARINYLTLEVREVGEWTIERDLPWLR